MFCHAYYHQKAKYYKHSPFNNWTWHAAKSDICENVQILQKGVIGKRILKVKAAQKGRPKIDVKHSIWIQSFFNFLPSQIKSDDIPPEVKLDDANNTGMGKANKVIKCEYRFCLNCLAAYYLSGKNEEESQCPAWKINTLNALVLNLVWKICWYYLKYNATHVVKRSTRYNHWTKHIQNCSLNIWSPSTLLVTAMDAKLHVPKKKMKLYPGKFLSL